MTWYPSVLKYIYKKAQFSSSDLTPLLFKHFVIIICLFVPFILLGWFHVITLEHLHGSLRDYYEFSGMNLEGSILSFVG